MKKIFFFVCLVSLGCAHRVELPAVGRGFTSPACRNAFRAAGRESADEQLNSVSELYSLSCFKEVVSLGSFVRTQYRSKFYEVSSELVEVLIPEGTLTSYVLESYERTYLSLLIAMSYLNLHNQEATLVELRKAQEEEGAFLYNYGADPVLSLLQASLWDRFDPGRARPHWKFLSEIQDTEVGYDRAVAQFARARIHEIDLAPAQTVAWRVVGIGLLPELDWSMQFLNVTKNTYSMKPKTPFPMACANANEALVSTASWIHKIDNRYKSDYHPMLYVKSLARLPIALTYGVVGVSAGLGVGVAGCILTAKDDSGRSCAYSMEAAGYLMGKAADMVVYTVKPDLRHWSHLPSAFFVSRIPSALGPEACLSTDNLASMKTLYLID